MSILSNAQDTPQSSIISIHANISLLTYFLEELGARFLFYLVLTCCAVGLVIFTAPFFDSVTSCASQVLDCVTLGLFGVATATCFLSFDD